MRRSARIRKGTTAASERTILSENVIVQRQTLRRTTHPTKKERLPRQKAVNISESFRFLDLPREIRHIIYNYYYGSFDLMLKYYHTRTAQHVFDLDKLWVAMSTVGGERVEKSLHQVSRQLAREATPLWHERSTRLTIRCDTENEIAFDDFLPEDVCGDLASRLTTLVFRTSKVISDAKWRRLLQKCPELRNVETVVTEVARFSIGNNDGRFKIEHLVHHLMNSFPHDRWFGDLPQEGNLQELARMLRERCGNNYSVTTIARTVGYDPSNTDTRRPCEDTACAALSVPSCIDGIPVCVGDQVQYETEVTFGISPNRTKIISKVCHSIHHPKAQWYDGMERPEVAQEDSGAWEPMKLARGNNSGKEFWIVPRVTDKFELRYPYGRSNDTSFVV